MCDKSSILLDVNIMSILLSGNRSILKRVLLVIADLTVLRSCEKSFKGSEASAQDLSVHFERLLF